LNLKKPGGALKISLTSGGETAKCLLSRLEPEGRNGGAMKFAPVTLAPETWPPLDWILMFEKAGDFQGWCHPPLKRFGLRCCIEHLI